jgi:hypothetical protein
MPPLGKAEPRGRITGPGLLEHLFVVRPTVTTDDDDDPKPDITEHPNCFRMLRPPPRFRRGCDTC